MCTVLFPLSKYLFNPFIYLSFIIYCRVMLNVYFLLFVFAFFTFPLSEPSIYSTILAIYFISFIVVHCTIFRRYLFIHLFIRLFTKNRYLLSPVFNSHSNLQISTHLPPYTVQYCVHLYIYLFINC